MTYHRLVRDDARAFGLAWFQLLAQRQPQMAFQLTLDPGDRQPLDSDLWTVYRNSPERRKALKEYVDGPLVKTLLALGESATVRYWGTEDFSGEKGSETLNQIVLGDVPRVRLDEDLLRRSRAAAADNRPFPSASTGFSPTPKAAFARPGCPRRRKPIRRAVGRPRSASPRWQNP